MTLKRPRTVRFKVDKVDKRGNDAAESFLERDIARADINDDLGPLRRSRRPNKGISASKLVEEGEKTVDLLPTALPTTNK